MQPTMEILAKINQSSMKNPNEIFTRLYRYLLREDIYFVAYQKLYANNGAGTKGVDDDTADGFSQEKISKIINALNDGSYIPKPVRREYIRKKNNSAKKRPLGIPTFTDKIIQEIIRMILEAIYEPLFLDCSHGFRPKKSCHTALEKIKGWNGTKWFVEGDIKGCFDNIDHHRLIEIVGNKVKDKRFTDLIWKFLRAGYIEEWRYNRTYSGTPQGGIISPILANIYLNELDQFVLNLQSDFNKKAERKFTIEYQRLGVRMDKLRKRIRIAEGEKRASLIERYEILRKQKIKTPCKSQTDKVLRYVRYADDFLIGINGSKTDSEMLKSKLKKFIFENLKMELSEEKTYITHSSEPVKFLGYHISVRRNQKLKPDKNGVVKRSLNETIQLTIPFKEKIEKFLWDKKAVRIKENTNALFPAKRDYLLNLTDLEIVSTYKAEMQGIMNFYNKAVDYNKLIYFNYLMQYSCLMTLARKHKSKIGKIITKYKDGHGRWGIPYETKAGNKRLYLPYLSDCRDKRMKDEFANNVINHSFNTTSFEKRLKAKTCELCGASGDIKFAIHHVNKVKNLKGKSNWEMIMIAKRRKTLVVCLECHNQIHGVRN